MESQIDSKLIEEETSRRLFKHRYYSVGDFRRLNNARFKKKKICFNR